MNLGRDHGTDPVCEGRDSVHEDPESGQSRRRLHHTAESERHGEKKDNNCAGSFGVGKSGNNHLSECAGVDEELNAEQKNGHLTDGARYSDDGVEVAGVNEDTGDNHVGDLDDDVGDQEGLPAVSF